VEARGIISTPWTVFAINYNLFRCDNSWPYE